MLIINLSIYVPVFNIFYNFNGFNIKKYIE